MLRRISTFLFGAEPRALLPLASPALFGLVIDLVLRPGALAGYAMQGKLIYLSSLLISAAFWLLPLVLASRLFHVRAWATQGRARLALFAFFGLWVLPLVTCGYVAQPLYYRL